MNKREEIIKILKRNDWHYKGLTHEESADYNINDLTWGEELTLKVVKEMEEEENE